MRVINFDGGNFIHPDYESRQNKTCTPVVYNDFLTQMDVENIIYSKAPMELIDGTELRYPDNLESR